MRVSSTAPAIEHPRPSYGAIASAAVAIGVAVLGGVMVSRDTTPLYRVLAGTVTAGDAVNTGNDGARLALVDGSRVEMRSFSGLSVGQGRDGLVIRLRNGGVIVTAAPQGLGRLRVEASDLVVAVGKTVFVDAGSQGSRVSVIEGDAQVWQGSREQRLRPGEQLSTRPSVPSPPIVEEIAWSTQALILAKLLEIH